jgi:hypothetical protein
MSTQFGLVSRFLSNVTRSADNALAKLRTNHLGELVNSPDGQIQYALEGSTFVATTPVPGTGVALTVAAQAAFNALAPAIFIRNTAAVGGKDINVRRLRLIATAAGTGLTALESLTVVDSNPTRYTSGGAAMVPVNTKADDASASIAQVFNASTAIVAAAAGAGTRVIARTKLKGAIPVIHDNFAISYGAEPTVEMGPLSGATASLFTHSGPALIIPPQCCALIYIWGAGMTAAPTFEVALEMVER